MAGQLSPDEAKFYRGVFVTLDWMNNKQIPANPQLKLLLSSSRLPVATLGQLWVLSYALATNNKRDWLTDRDLCIVLRLISVAQAGQTPSYEAIKAPNLPLPKIDINMLREAHKKAIADGQVPAPGAAHAAGTPASPAAAAQPTPAAAAQPTPAAAAQPTPAAAAQPTPAAAAQPTPAAAAQPTPASQAVPAAGSIDWTMSDKQKQDYARSFEQLDPNKTGIISAVDAVGFLRKSKLPENILREIWKLSDLGRDGALDLTEFCIAMHLVLKARGNVPIPPTLPSVLLPAKYAADAEEKANALKEQQAKETQAKEAQAKEAQEKERAAKEAQEKEQQAKEAQAKEQAAKEAELKEQQQKELDEKEKQEKEKQQEQPATTSAVSEGKTETSENEEPKSEPPKSKFTTRPTTSANPEHAASSSSAPPSGRSRESKPSEERGRSPKPRTAVSPSPRAPSPSSRLAPVATNNSSTGLPPAPVAPLPGKKQDMHVASRISSSPLPVKNPDAPKGVKATAVRQWVEAVLHEKIPVSISLGEALKSGVRLCKMLNAIEPDSVLDISNGQFMRRENILAFLDALRKKGFKPDKLFLVDELFEMQNIDAVIDTMNHLDAYAGTVKYEGPRLKA